MTGKKRQGEKDEEREHKEGYKEKRKEKPQWMRREERMEGGEGGK